MEIFLKNALPHEIIVCQRYLERCGNFHFVISFLNYLSASTVLCTPMLVGDRALPTSAVYPFPSDSGIGMVVAYLHQILVGFQCSSGVTIDCQAALMAWFAGARLEILADELRYVNDIKSLKIIVRKYGVLIAYAVDVSSTLAYVALTSSMACGVTAIMSSIQLCGVRNSIILVFTNFHIFISTEGNVLIVS